MSAELEAAITRPVGDDTPVHPVHSDAASVALSARGLVDEAFAFDRAATRLLYVAETRLNQAENDLAAYVDPGYGTDHRYELNHAVATAKAGLAASAEYRARCRDALSERLDGLAASGTSANDGRSTGYSSSFAAAAVVAEATAIAATAEQTLADELHFATVQAAKIAEEAVAAAAATVARAAEASRQSREVAATLAAADVAAEAAATAASVQDHADVLAAVTAETARTAAEQLPRPGTAAAASTATLLAEQVTETAKSQTDETSAAARIVASAVSADATALAAITSATAATAEQDVLAAAIAVQAVADAAARDLALPDTRRFWESARQITHQRALDTQNAATNAIATTAHAAQHARAARVAAAALAAATVAQAAEQTADAVQLRADQLADIVATSAAAASVMLSTTRPSGEVGGDDAAIRAHSAMVAAAVTEDEQTVLAAALVARAVAATAEAVAARNEAEEIAIENQVRDTALTLQAITSATAMRLATATLERETSFALATRTAAVANERLSEANRQLESAGRHDRAVAVALQQAMLSELPQPAGMTMAARYLTAVEQDRVGGDWYDALLLPSGAVTVMIGDVVGHDIVAAAMMGQLRNVLRTLVWENREPTSAVVGRMDAVVRDLHLATLASLILVNIDDPMTSDGSSVASLRWSNAGHPAPILVHADGTALILDEETDIILGVKADSVRHVHEHAVPPGATLLLYTDGLIETRAQAQDLGRQRLLNTVRAHHRLELNEMLDTVLADMIESHPSDDIAVLAVRFGNEPRPRIPPARRG